MNKFVFLKNMQCLIFIRFKGMDKVLRILPKYEYVHHFTSNSLSFYKLELWRTKSHLIHFSSPRHVQIPKHSKSLQQDICITIYNAVLTERNGNKKSKCLVVICWMFDVFSCQLFFKEFFRWRLVRRVPWIVTFSLYTLLLFSKLPQNQDRQTCLSAKLATDWNRIYFLLHKRLWWKHLWPVRMIRFVTGEKLPRNIQHPARIGWW